MFEEYTYAHTDSDVGKVEHYCNYAGNNDIRVQIVILPIYDFELHTCTLALALSKSNNDVDMRTIRSLPTITHRLTRYSV
jgi:hypothetical protein